MDKKIKKILNDLYMIDPSFKNQEKEITKIVEELLMANPNVKIDRGFVQNLRSMLFLEAEKININSSNNLGFRNDFTFKKKLAYSFIGSFMTLILVLTAFLMYYPYKEKFSPGFMVFKEETKSNITKLASNAFGSLSESQADLSKNRSQSGGGTGIGGGGGLAASSLGPESSIMPFPLAYRFIYRGEDFTVDNNKNIVYKRISDKSFNEKLTGIVQNLSLELIDLNQLNNLEVSNITVSENRDFGYEVSSNSREGIIYINQNWLEWPDPYSNCSDQLCYEQLRLKISDIPSDEELILIADNFMEKYGIKKGSYENPVVSNDYEYQILSARDKSNVYVPEYISVIYPIKVDDNLVYDVGGNLDGIVVDVSIRHKKVSSARNIYFEKYESSDYEIETDANRIIKFAESNGIGSQEPSYYGDLEVVEIELGTPSFGLVKNWKYNQERRMSEEIYVPSYIFPIVKMPEDKYYYRKNVIVPIVKDMMESSGVIYPAIPEIQVSSEEVEKK